MVLRLEESIAAIASPALLPSEASRRRFCTATFDGTRYMFYAVDTFLVILSENHEQAVHNNPRSEAKRCSQFDLRQVWSVQAKVNCVAFNPMGKRVARGAVALCIDDKRIVLLTPTGAPTTTPVAATAMATKPTVKTSDADLQPVSKRRPSVFTGRTSTDVSNEYAKVHLYLQLPTWKESIRWRSEDQHLDRVKWVESGDDLLLVGVGEKISVWKVVEESGLQAYLQHSFSIGEPDQRVWHFDVTHTGRYVASAREHDRILKVWSLGELAHDGKPISLFLPHQRALVSVQWAKNWHSYKIRHHDPLMPRVEMLYALDKNGDISIWREHVASSHRSFVLWRRFTTQDFLLSSSCTVDSERVDDGSLQHAVLASRLQSFGLVQNNWGRPIPRAPMAVTDALLERNTVLSALSLFHYGYASIDEVRRNELTNQRMDGIGKIHSKLLGDRSGMIADTHSGETLLNGNAPLNKTFVVNLAYAVHENGDFSLFRVESVHFSAVAPRIALLCVFSGLREQLVDATVYSICSSDYKDRENGSSAFIVEIVFQPQQEERHAKIARLKFQAESTVFGARDSRAMASYSVQMCEVSDISPAVMAAITPTQTATSSLPLAKVKSLVYGSSSGVSVATASSRVAIAHLYDGVEVLRTGKSLQKLRVGCRAHSIANTATHSVCYEEQGILFFFSEGKIHASMLSCESAKSPSNSPMPSGLVGTNPNRNVNSISAKLLFSEEDAEANGIIQLIRVGVSPSQKKAWSAAPTSIFFSAPATSEPEALKDFCMLVGLKPGGSALIVWVFSFEPNGIGDDVSTVALTDSMQLFRRAQVDIPASSLLAISPAPSLDLYDSSFCSVDTDQQFKLWCFRDMEDLSELTCAHSINVSGMLKASNASHTDTNNQDNMQFFVNNDEFKFHRMSLSACGRAALLFEELSTTKRDFRVCVLSLLDHWHESVVTLPQQKFGAIVSLEWTPPTATTSGSQLVFLSSCSIGVIQLDSTSIEGSWKLGWSSSRFDIKPRGLSSMQAYPNALVALDAGIARLDLKDFSLFVTPESSQTVLSGVIANAVHPLTLLFLLMRGSFKSLDQIVVHIQKSIGEHEKTCYLKMTEDADLRNLPLLELENLFGKPVITTQEDERPLTYRNGKGASQGTPAAAVSSAPARASDLFAMDFGSSRRFGRDRAEDLFASRVPAISSDSTSSTEASQVPDKLELESDGLLAFFDEHKEFLAFVPDSYRPVFLNIIKNAKKIIQWERNTGRAKDEAALRFITSLMWPYNSSGVGPGAKKSVELEIADASDSSPNGICSEQISWAAVSDCQAELLEECFRPTMTLSMKDLTQLRLPFWVKSATRLTQYAEKVAQAEYASTRDPFRVALLYVLLGKIKLLSNLFNMGNEKKIAELLRNDFSEERWKIAAVKNAYVLKAKCRYELSATFFLLGGKVQEAMSVMENEDPSLVLSFLIARLSEKWDLGGQGDESGGYNAFNDASFTGLSTSLRNFGADGGQTGSNCKDVCKEYLKTTVFEKAQRCGDIYMCFLVKYYIGETANAIQCLLTVPTVEMQCIFDGPPSIGSQLGDSRLYWSVFGQSLLGAIDLVRFLRPIIRPLSTSIKTQIVRTQALTLNRLVGSGWNVMALYHQRDFAEQFKQFCRDNASDSSLRGAFLSIRNRILCNTISQQTVSLAISTAKRISQSLNQRASFESSLPIEQRLKAEIMCLIRRSGAFSIDEIDESKDDTVEQALRSAVVETLSHSDQNYLLDFILHEWSSKDPARSPISNPLPQLIEKIVDSLSWIASGDLTTLGTTHFHSRRIDQLCSELLTSAESLLCWLAYYFAKPAEERSVFHSSAEYIRVISASVYSIICVCCRYVKSPCCLHRALTAIFPHMDSLPKKILDEIKEISLADVCANCSTSRVGADAEASAGPPLPSLQQDIPVLYQVIQMLQRDLNLFVEEVRTNRLDLMPPAASQFTYCQYWTLSVMLAVSGMPTHISRVAVDGANPHALSTTLAKRLVQTSITYNANMSKYATRLLLCELIESYFRPFDLQRPSTPTGASSKDNSGGTPTISPTAAGMANVISPNHRDRRESRQLLRCSCDRCPWLLILKIFADKDELLLRINSQLECCSEKIKEDISWGHLPDFPSKKAVFTRSQKILLSSAGAGKAAEITDLLERRFQHSTPAISVSTNCIYRSEVSIKSLCFNQSTETGEMVLCSSKGICRAASVEYSDGMKYQFKGMYANPQAAFFSDTNAGTSGLPVSRRRSADTSLMPRGTTDSPQKGLDSPSLLSATGLSEMKTPSFKPSTVESHPFLPLFVSGNQKGKIHLWSYESLSSVCEFQTKEIVTTYQLSPATSSRRDIKRLQFDSLGQQMGAVDTFGRLFMWKFANLEREACYREIECHDKGAKALKFINSGTIVATVGTSTDKRSMCMWDLLLPSSKALIAAPTCHPAGAASLAFSQAHQLVISGGEGGSISVFDVRQRRVLHTISNAHETAITTLELHPSGRCVLSGSASGDVKIWSLPIFRELVSVSKVHAKPSFLGDAASNLLGDAASNMAINVTNSSWGVTDAVATDDYFFTSGTDGSVQRFKVPSFDKLY